MEEKTVLSVKELNISFRTRKGEVNVIRGVNLELPRGKTLAIVGESGSGKSVTAKAITGLLPENAVINGGSIELTTQLEGREETVDLLKKDIPWLRRNINGRKIAMVFQDPMTSLDPLIPVGKQVMEGILWHSELSKEEAERKAWELLTEVGLTDVDTRMKQYPHQLSGGQRQRVVIAIALACDPEVLVCDEPTTALDVTMQSRILSLIMELQVKRGLSIIFITHNLGVVAKIADYIYVMYAGRVVERGSELELFFDPRHPYTWGLLAAMPTLDTSDRRLYYIPGTPPNLAKPVKGDAFAPRNRYALNIDYEQEPPMFRISDTHYAATWLLDPRAPKTEMPEEVSAQIRRMKESMRKEMETDE